MDVAENVGHLIPLAAQLRTICATQDIKASRTLSATNSAAGARHAATAAERAAPVSKDARRPARGKPGGAQEQYRLRA